MSKSYKSLFPYFGGKSEISAEVWKLLGPVKNYVEPFLGSGAVYFTSPFDHTSTLNDFSGHMVNLWRSIKRDHAAVAEEASYLIGEHDVHACEVEALNKSDELTRRLEGDIEFYDPKLAGRYLWGLSNKIGSFAVDEGPWVVIDGVLTDKRTLVDAAVEGVGISREMPCSTNKGVTRQIPNACGRGVSRQIPVLGTAGTGISRKIPSMGGGRGVSRALPFVGNTGMGISRKLGDGSRVDYIMSLMDYFVRRLEHARICCGDWARVCKSRSVTTCHGLTGIFLDPPYEVSGDVYKESGCFRDVVAWAASEGNNPLLRLVLAGYDCPEVDASLVGWRKVKWKQKGGYGGGKNSDRETIWASPGCLVEAKHKQADLFEDL
jgi:site-specific DNA-adenine methylase